MLHLKHSSSITQSYYYLPKSEQRLRVPKNGVWRSKRLLKHQLFPHQHWSLELRTSLTGANPLIIWIPLRVSFRCIRSLTDGAIGMEIEDLSRVIGPTGVDITTDVSVRINDTVTAQAVSSFALPSQQQFIVHGSSGTIRTEVGESFTTWNEASSLHFNDAVEEFAVTNAFVEMVENVSRVIEGEEGWVVPSVDSIRVAYILDSIARHQ